MVIQLSKGVILHSDTRWRWFRRRTYWAAAIHQGRAETAHADSMNWEVFIEFLPADQMLLRMIAMGFPQSDIGLFIQALNNPGVIPFNPKLAAVKAERLPHRSPPSDDYPQISREPRAIFHPEAGHG